MLFEAKSKNARPTLSKESNGITLIDLMAFLIDQQVYTSGFVSDRHLTAFASLLGVQPKAATPAIPYHLAFDHTALSGVVAAP